MLNEKEIMQYVQQHSTPEDAVLVELDRQTHLRVVQPRMLSGHVQGLMLQLMTAMIQPKRVLEIGTFTGYSAICMARGMTEGAVLHTIDPNDEIGGIAQEHIEKAGFGKRIVRHIGSALDVIPTLGEVFDLVFIDGDKREYIDYYRLIMEGGYVRSGSFIFADNVLWDGKVIEDEQENPKLLKDPYTQTIKQFNRMVHSDARVEVVIMPLRDGMSLIRVK